MDNFNRPFEILKLIRDGEVTKIHDLMVIHDSHFSHYVRLLIGDLQEAGLIEVTKDGNLTPTPLLAKILRSLGACCRV